MPHELLFPRQGSSADICTTWQAAFLPFSAALVSTYITEPVLQLKSTSAFHHEARRLRATSGHYIFNLKVNLLQKGKKSGHGLMQEVEFIKDLRCQMSPAYLFFFLFLHYASQAFPVAFRPERNIHIYRHSSPWMSLRSKSAATPIAGICGYCVGACLPFGEMAADYRVRSIAEKNKERTL